MSRYAAVGFKINFHEQTRVFGLHVSETLTDSSLQLRGRTAVPAPSTSKRAGYRSVMSALARNLRARLQGSRSLSDSADRLQTSPSEVAKTSFDVMWPCKGRPLQLLVENSG